MFVLVQEQLICHTNKKNIIDAIKRRLTYDNPQYKRTIALGYSAYNIPIQYQCYKTFNQGIIVPRGAIHLLHEICKSYSEPLKFIDKRTEGESLDIYLETPMTPYWYQQNAIDAILEYQRGMVVGPCGCGKSFIGIFTALELKVSTLIIVHTSELYRQWKSEIQKNIGGNFKLGLIGGGKRNIGDITIAMIQTLHKLNAKQWRQIQLQFGLVFLDESHHSASDTYIKVMEMLRAKYIIGLTATPNRKDKKNFLIENYLGRVIYEIHDHDLEMSGKLVPCVVFWYETGVKINYTALGQDHNRFAGAIAKDLSRANKIIQNILIDIQDGFIPMILVERTVHARLLYGLLEAQGLKVSECTGAISQEDRARIRDDLTKNKTQVLIANKQIAAEGMNIPCLSSVHLAFYTTDTNLIKQAIGRARRPYQDKDHARVWQYVDEMVETSIDELTFQESEIPSNKFKYGYSSIRSYFKNKEFEIKEV